MKKTKYENDTTEELKAKINQRNTLSALLLIVLIVSSTISISSAGSSTFNVLYLLPFIIFPIGIVNFVVVRNMKKEIESREKK